MLLVDAIARRYGKWPHEVLRLSPGELSIALSTLDAGDSAVAEMVGRISRTKGGMVFPVVTING